MTDRSTQGETMAKKRNRSARQKVLAAYPGAAAYRDKYGQYEISNLKVLGHGRKEKDAWENAAENIAKIDHGRLGG